MELSTTTRIIMNGTLMRIILFRVSYLYLKWIQHAVDNDDEKNVSTIPVNIPVPCKFKYINETKT